MNTTQGTMPALLTYDDYCLIPEDGRRYEVIQGELYMNASPIIRHQGIVVNLTILLGTYLKNTKVGRILVAPMDVILSEHNVVQPDLLFIAEERLSIITEKNVQGAPDLLIEILSEGSRRHDEVVKRKLYESFGVQEFWIVDPVLETVKVYLIQESRYSKLHELSAEANDTLTSLLLPKFACPLQELFK